MDYLPSSFFKRLLRYVISRFELIDSSALDLDSLGVRWGHQSTVEFRDLDLRLEKLASLLHLPPSSRLLSARVRLLRIIIPTATDFYKRSVIVQASGIEVHIRLPSEEGCPGKDGQPSSQQAELDPILPNPADLAESFLETEPLEEKEELQAAIESRSQVLQRTTGSLSDDEEELGLGNEDMSLPSFLAGFFKGVAERLQVQVDDIAIRLDVETKQDGTSKRQPEDRPDLVTGLVTVGQVKVDAVVMPSAEDPAPPQQGKRLVSVSDINLDMISEPIVFANYSRFTAPPASPSTPVQSKPSPPPSRGSSPPPDDSSNSSSALAMTQSTIFERPQDLTQSVTQERTVPEMERSTYTYDGRFSDAASDDGHPYYGYLEDSQNLAYDDDILDNPGCLDSAIRSQLQDDNVESPEHFAPHGNHSLTNRDGTPRLDTHGTRIASLQDSYTDESTGRSPSPEAGVSLRGHYLLGPETEAHEPAPSESQLYQHSQSKDSPNNLASSHLSEPASETASSGSTSSSYKDTGLSESRLFSNEEAQSMYMSAFSHGNTAKSFMPNMPGAWDSPEETIGDASVHGQSGGSRNWHETSRNDDDPDETGISTPKLTAQSESQIMHGHAHGSQRAQSEATDRESSQSSPGLNRISDVAKRLFSVDKVLIWVSEGEASDEPAENPTPQGYERSRGDSLDSTVNLQESIATGDLLASGMQSSTRFRSDSVDPSVSPDTKPSSPQVSIEIFAVECQIDLATGWLAVKVGQRILSAFTPADGTPKKKTPSEATPSKQSFGISLDKLSIKFVEHIPAHNRSPEDSQQAFFGMLHQDIILQATASGLQSAFSEDGNLTKFRLDISKFALGFATEDLISFSEDLKMRESTRDVLSPVRGDLSLSLSKSSESARVSLTTLPLQVNLNVPRLEEALEWLGGLSTILELGNSISSASGTKGTKKTPPKRARGVHFEAAAPPAVASQSDSVPWKVDVRLGGIALDLAGEAHYLKLRTTAVKAVSRFEGVAIQIDKAKINGPIPLDDEKDAPAKMNLSNIRVEYLYTPKETDLARLLSLITPSQDKYDEEDDIMVDTLLRQRKQGSVLRVNVGGTKLTVSRTADLDSLSQLGDEIGRLSNVAKYLPEDDRPGIMTLALIRDFEAHVHVGGKVGDITARLKNAEGAFVSIPSLVAAQFASISVLRNQDEELLGEALIPDLQSTIQSPHPVLMARYIADEMEPTIKVKLHHLRVEYTVPALIAFLGLGDDVTTGNVAANMAHSIADIAEIQPSPQTTPSSKPSSPKENDKPIKLGVALRDCVVGLNPRGTNAKGLLVLTNSKFSGAIHDPASSEAVLDLRKASLMVIDDVQNVESAENIRRVSGSQINQIQCFIDQGFVPVSTISSATATLKIMQLSDDGTKSLDVELKDDLLILETCADSTQTLINIVNGLQPPAPPIVATKYRTEVLPIQDMLASLSGDAFEAETASDPDGGSQSFAVSEEFDDQGKHIEDEVEYVSDFDPLKQGAEPDFAHDGMAGSTNNLLDSFHSQYYVSSSISDLDIQEDHFANRSSVGGTAHRWDSARNTYGLPDDSKLQKSPLRIRVRDAHVIWNLFDGYDWQRTRDTISKAVKDVEKKATERRARPGGGASPGFEEDEESVIGDCLFNSIYIGIPANKDPRELRNDINRNIDDLMSETGSYATTTTVTGATARRQSQSPSHRKKLRLSRSKYHKMTFELKGICADLVVFPPDSGETQSSLDVRVNDLEIFDHVPTSTWKKFATFMHEAGEKETGTNMVHLEILTVRPVPDLAASEIVLKATLLPLRLHVDQDALDFLSRFFEFRDESAPAPSAPGDIPFLQRVEVNAVPVKLDFKPKRVDYAGLRSGRTTEFMNFFVLDGADMVMRRVILYGVAGFDKLGKSLNDIWMPDIKRNQLPSVLAGLAPIRSLVNVGGGVKDLVVIPMREYRKDGRLVRSIQKGAVSFAKTTSNELVKLGAKLAIGTQTVLQGAEEMLNNPTPPVVYPDEEPSDEEEAKKISLYAEQPVGVVQGLRGAYRGLERDLILARDAIVAVPGEVVESGSARAAAKAVWKHTPTVVLRPAIGVSKAVGQTLLGAGNTLDPSNRRKMEDKYKRH